MQTVDKKAEIRYFSELNEFSKAVEEAGFMFDFQSVAKLNTSFLKTSDKCTIINIKDYEDQDPNNLLFLGDGKSFAYSKKPPPAELYESFSKVLDKPYGKCTVLAFLTLDKAVDSYKTRLDTLVNGMRDLEQTFDAKKYRDLFLEFERLYDRLEDFHDIVIRLEERTVKEVETRHISFDYSILLAETTGLLDRCRNRFNMLKDVARDNEREVTTELNRRIERLNEVMKKLTALTVILMIPNIISGHFGMNFQYMYELSIREAYPIVIVIQITLTVTAAVIFRKVKWL